MLGAVVSTVTYVYYANAEPVPTTPTISPDVVVQTGATTTNTPLEYGPNEKLSQPNFFADTLKAFIASKQSFVEADLSHMKIRYYDHGTTTFEADILTKGKEGSWWETPSGLYAVENKEPTHFSSFGQVNTAWNMDFQGNFFIHGWPYYPNGTPVSSKFSGGCIRLSDADAKALYEHVSVHTPILVYEGDYASDGFQYHVTAPTIDAKAYLVADIKSNAILMQSGASSSLPIASLTKLMTALVAAEYINLDKNFTVPESAMTYTSVETLKAGQTMSGYSLLLPLILESSNVAANTLGQIVGTERFVSLMNKKAASLGMTHTTFTDPSGADSGNVSTLTDLLRLATYIYNNRSFIYQISTGKNVETAYNVYKFNPLKNFNPVPGLTGFIGGKVGKTTAADETIISLYTMTIRGEERPVVFIALGTQNNYQAVTNLYHYMDAQYGSIPAASDLPISTLPDTGSSTPYMMSATTTEYTTSPSNVPIRAL